MVTAEGYLLTDAVTVPPDSQEFDHPRRPGLLDGGGQRADERRDDPPAQLRQRGRTAAAGNNYYQLTAASGQPSAAAGRPGRRQHPQGALERSNVETVDELVSLIVAQRNYEVNSRAIRVSDEMLQQINQLVR